MALAAPLGVASAVPLELQEQNAPTKGSPNTQNHSGASQIARKDWSRFSTAYFTYPCFMEKITKEQIHRKVQDAVESNSEVLMFFIMQEGYALYPSKTTERDPFALDFDVLAEVAAAAKAKNLRLVACWMGVHGVSRLAELHPSWTWRDAKGKPAPRFHRMCLNSPFQNLLLEQIKEVVTGYAVDGVYFDGIYELVEGCYCDYCREKFREEFGRDLPKNPHDPLMTRFRMQAVEDTCHSIRNLINESAPSTLFIMDTLGVRAYESFGQDLTQLRRYLDVFLLEAYWEYTGQPIWYVGMERRQVAAETRKPVWFPCWFPLHPNGNFAPIPKATIRLWAGEALVNQGAPVCVEQDLFDIDRSRFPTLQTVFKGIKKISPYMRGSKPLPYAGLLHSVATKELLISNRALSNTDNFKGAYMALLEHHIPFEVITEGTLSFHDLKRFKVLVVVDALCMTQSNIEAIRQYVSHGGGLVATYRSSYYDEDGHLREHFGLADILGVDASGFLLREGPIGPEQLGGREAVTYYRIAAGNPLADGLEGDFSSLSGGVVKVTPQPGVDVAAHILDYDYRKQDNPDRKWVWWPGKPSYPLITTKKEAGRAAYISGELTLAFWRHGLPEAGRLFVNTVRWAGGTPPFEVQAPGSVQVEVCTSPALGKDGLLCMFSNRTANPLYLTNRSGAEGAYQYVREVVPVHDVKVRIKTPASDIKETLTITGRPVRVHRASGNLHLSLPVLDEYEAVIIG